MKILIRLLQYIAGIIFITVGFYKFVSTGSDVLIFTELGMEPHGRYIIGSLEILAGFLLFTNQMTAWGSFLGLGVMVGALIAHLTVLGFDVNGDGGFHMVLFVVTTSSCLLVTWHRRTQLPFLSQ